MRKKLVFALLVAAIAAALAVGSATAGNGKSWGQPSRGSDQGFIWSCNEPINQLFVGDTCIAATIQVPPTGQALNNGQFEITAPPGTTVSNTVFDAISYGGSNPCDWTGGYSVSGQTITVSGLTCPQDSGFVVFFGADVESAVGSYTLDGDYKINASKRSSTNVFRYAQDPVVDVETDGCGAC